MPNFTHCLFMINMWGISSVHPLAQQIKNAVSHAFFSHHCSAPDAPDVWVWINGDSTGLLVWKVLFFPLFFIINWACPRHLSPPWWLLFSLPYPHSPAVFLASAAHDSQTEPRSDQGLQGHFLEPRRKCAALGNHLARFFCRTCQSIPFCSPQRRPDCGQCHCREQRWAISIFKCHHPSQLDRYVLRGGKG